MIIRELLNRAFLAIVATSMLSTAAAGSIQAQTPPPGMGMGGGKGGLNYMDMSKMGKTTAADRKAAAERQSLTRAASRAAGVKAPTVVITPGMTPDYFGATPNYANTQLPELDENNNVIPGTGVRKFVDGLPGVGPSGANNLGQYLVVGVADPNSYPGSDYYEIGLVDYMEKMHSDIPTTTLRGYFQIATAQVPGKHIALRYLKSGLPILDRNGQQVYAVDNPSYLGPTLVAQKDKPVRVKFTNYIANGTDGNLFIPVDTTDMGAGVGPLGGGELYTENRATLHLHGGATPWISDGTPHQWTTPANEATSYPKGVSVSNVPDMPDPGPGSLTFFYTNQQSARLMFYHDHAYGMTRLNVYAGEAAGYLLQDPIERQLVLSGTIPADVIPLIIQDKTFVPKVAQLQAEDPTWDPAKWGGQGNLWFPHVYMPNQNPWDISGAAAMGRWDYGPWFWPPFTGQYVQGEITNPYANPALGEPPMIPGTPKPSLVPEGYMDTPVVNGTAYPSMTVEARPYRFRILNAANDRFWNLSLFTAASNNPMWAADGTLLDANAGEVSMVPAVASPDYPASWPTDGRDGGVPDPNAAGPSFVQIGTEGGFLPAPVVVDPSPVGYLYNRRDIVVLNVNKHALWLGPAERADVVVDFSKYAGKTLILYNDSPAPVPAFDPRNDYYTNDPDQTSTGGAPSTLPGYGPNTRTIMQIKVKPAIVPGAITGVNVINTGAQYSAPKVTFSGGGGGGAAAVASGPIDRITVAVLGSGYSSAPSVAFADMLPGTGTGATAKASISVQGVQVTSIGSGYTSVPSVTITDLGGTGTGATAVATLSGDAVTTVTLLTTGSGYTSPTVTFTDGGGGSGAAAITTGILDSFTWLTAGNGYSQPSISFVGGNPTAPALALATFKIISITVTNGGTGYTSDPLVKIIDTWPGNGFGATAVAFRNPSEAAFDVAALNVAWAANGATPGVFARDQDPILIPDARYDSAYGKTFPVDQYARLQYNQMTFTSLTGTLPISMTLLPKTIQELFELDYGRMNATLGTELPNTTGVNQTTIPLGYTDPTTENLTDSITPSGVTTGDGTQIWKVVHNGVDTHAIHFHLFNVQLLNRVGWDGAVRPPEDNELGWKETVKMHPLEIAFVVLRPVAPKLPFGVPESIRAMNPTMPLGATWPSIDPATGNPNTIINAIVNYGWEYVWHCHLLGHEENDMMRPIIFQVQTQLPFTPVLTGKKAAVLTWTDGTPQPANLGNPQNEIGFRVYRNTGNGAYSLLSNQLANSVVFTDTTVQFNTTYHYTVTAYNVSGSVTSNIFTLTTPTSSVPAAPSNASVAQNGLSSVLKFKDNSSNETGFVIKRSISGTNFITLTTILAQAGQGSTVVFTDTSVVIGNFYTYTVQAVNATLAPVGYFISSPSNAAVVRMNPLQPVNLRVTGTGVGSISIAWTNVQTIPVQTYVDVTYSLNGSTAWTYLILVGPTVTSYTNIGLPSGTTRFYQVFSMLVNNGFSYFSPGSNIVSGRAQ